ncbi:MAG: hypothetical protein WAU00_17140 [Caldilinea sp.]|uniref:hypothetical protein n=1 Tax=Caldilinea sp. TaxID=2293560 RepID=UPI002B700818|nr:DUF4440 domain-containing protein [Anaerolineales bacterium]HQY91758.1 DUF4440 domain-containing protein [Caldilinea sp.]HRA65292.1 DUF4440 domain-containing protein [Caldilinea sp.]
MQQHPAIQEVIDLHTFFEAWLGGALPASDAAFARFATTTDPDFILIDPDGKVMEGDAVAGWIRRAHGTRRSFRLWTTDHRVRYEDSGCAFVTYLEWQTRDGVTTCRISTALLIAHTAAPNGLRWRHVHETWTSIE